MSLSLARRIVRIARCGIWPLHQTTSVGVGERAIRGLPLISFATGETPRPLATQGGTDGPRAPDTDAAHLQDTFLTKV